MNRQQVVWHELLRFSSASVLLYLLLRRYFIVGFGFGRWGCVFSIMRIKNINQCYTRSNQSLCKLLCRQRVDKFSEPSGWENLKCFDVIVSLYLMPLSCSYAQSCPPELLGYAESCPSTQLQLPEMQSDGIDDYLFKFQIMKDVALDDLIKEDKEKMKKNRGVKHNRLASRPISRIQGRRIIARKPAITHAHNRNPQFQQRLDRNPNPHPNRLPPRNPRNQKVKPQIPVPKTENPPQEKGRTLKVLGLHPDTTNNDLYKLFSAQGALEKCMIEQDNFGRNLPSAIVKYHRSEHAKSALIALNNYKVLNSILTVQPYKNVKN